VDLSRALSRLIYTRTMCWWRDNDIPRNIDVYLSTNHRFAKPICWLVPAILLIRSLDKASPLAFFADSKRWSGQKCEARLLPRTPLVICIRKYLAIVVAVVREGVTVKHINHKSLLYPTNSSHHALFTRLTTINFAACRTGACMVGVTLGIVVRLH
jgi:hypothetical protein